MKSLTPFLVRFAFAAIVMTVLFRFFLSYGIAHSEMTFILSSSILYGIGMFVAGWYFGKKDKAYLPLYDIGFRFHLTTYLVHNLISEGWFIVGWNAAGEKISSVHSTAIWWGVFLCLHFIYYKWTRKQTIDGLDKTELFE